MRLEEHLSESWKHRLQQEFKKDYFNKLADFITTEYAHHEVYPDATAIFRAFNTCPFETVKVVILGQDPYHGPKQADGLSFSVNDTVKFPPSLRNIFKELHADLGCDIPSGGSLDPWASNGVLLLNAALTVRAASAGSHQNKGWEQFTDAVIRAVSAHRQHVVFMLWGNNAQKKGALIDSEKHLILEAAHPSPLAAYRGFFGSGHFSKANVFLTAKNIAPIHWCLS